MTTDQQKAIPPGTEWCTRREAAELLRVSVATVDRYARAGHLTRYDNPAGRTRFRRDQVLGLIQPREEKAG